MISGKPAKVPFAAQKHPRKRLTWVEPLFWVLPALVIYVVFKLGPLLASFYFSLLRWNGIDPPKFVWFQNFQRILEDKQVGLALWHNVHFALGTVIGKIVLSLILALLLNNALRGRVFYRTSLFLPVVMSFVVVGILWTWMFDYRVGMINALLRLIHLNSAAQVNLTKRISFTPMDWIFWMASFSSSQVPRRESGLCEGLP